MLYGLELGLQRRFDRHGPYEMFQELKLIFKQMREVRDMKSPISSTAARWRRTVMLVNTYSECLDIIIT